MRAVLAAALRVGGRAGARRGEGAGGRSVPAPGPERVSEGPGLAPTQAGGARGGGRRRASNRKCTACSAALPLPPPPHAAPGPPRTAARRAGGGSSPLLSPPLPSPSPWPRRLGTRTQMISDSPRSPASVYPCPPKTRTRALGPADPAAAEARVSVGCASTRTCLSGNRGPRGPPAGMRTRMRTELPVTRAECGFSPPPHRTNPTRLLSGSPRDPRRARSRGGPGPWAVMGTSLQVPRGRVEASPSTATDLWCSHSSSPMMPVNHKATQVMESKKYFGLRRNHW
nr:translation initiation factor IF-2-like isoform X2 [Camelus dromedarius]